MKLLIVHIIWKNASKIYTDYIFPFENKRDFLYQTDLDIWNGNLKQFRKLLTKNHWTSLLLKEKITCWLNSSHIMKGVKLLRPLMTQK